MLIHARALEDTAKLIVSLNPGDAIEMENRSVGCETGPHCRMSIPWAHRSVSGEALPIGFVCQVCGQRLPAGHDQPVDLLSHMSSTLE